ncbi:rubrerythrin [Kroppenstedtia sanguinis]|uniref:Ferritin-like domain-containing protein n=1 Tax=Kroppenstedtia sanguinis TaxID=1380684 RepID=A0ABW4C8Q3_9BACL
MHLPHLYIAPSKNPDLILLQDIVKSINGQYNAITCYAQIAEMAPVQQKEKILGIRQEEIRHYHTFVNIYISLTGQKPPEITPEPCPKNYREALEFALKDEQETVDFYLHIADRALTPYIKQAYMRAAQDEQRHAVWFLFFWTKQYCLKSN